MVGDREHDILAAKAIGMASVGVLYGYGNFAELQTAGASFIIESVKELTQFLSEEI
jgi:phosphoglycolate phosphatase